MTTYDDGKVIETITEVSTDPEGYESLCDCKMTTIPKDDGTEEVQ